MSSPSPDPVRLAQIKQRMAQSWAPVKPLPAVSRTAASVALVAFLLVAGIPQIIGTAGFHRLTLPQLALYYGILAAAVLLLSPALVRRFRPGSLLRMNAAALASAAILLLAGSVLLLFPSMDVQHFAGGIRCLVTGSVCGALAAVLLGLLLRGGLATNPRRASAIAGFFAGLVGVFVLAVQCPTLTTPHILVWHLPVLAVTSAAGVAVGWVSARAR